MVILLNRSIEEVHLLFLKNPKKMKNLVIAFSMFMAMSTLVTAQTSTKPAKEKVQKATYSCPMHPKEIGKQGDKCSKCGMALTKVEAPKISYACPMHPKVTGKKGDDCSKCGMALTKVEAPKTSYACPMHPKVTGKKGDDCSKCGMALTKVDADKNK